MRLVNAYVRTSNASDSVYLYMSNL